MNRFNADNNLIKKIGRGKVFDGCFPMFFTASGVEANVKSTELWVELESDYEVYEPIVSVLIDGVRVMRFTPQKGVGKYMIYRAMNGEKGKHVRVTKDVQSMPEDEKHMLVFRAFECDGELEKIPDRNLKLEFVGDSISSGEGLIGPQSLEDWISWCFDSVNNYSNLVADALNADYRVVSQSGWGVNCSWDNNPERTIPAIYEKTCGTCSALKETGFDPFGANDFSWQPDVVIVNLGTNDAGAYSQPEYKNEKTGATFKNKMLENGKRDPESVKAFEKALVDFLHMLRKNNPNAHIIWCYGVCSHVIDDDITEAIDIYLKETADKKLSFLSLPTNTPEQVGARWHPGVLAHRMMADLVTDKIKELINVSR